MTNHCWRIESRTGKGLTCLLCAAGVAFLISSSATRAELVFQTLRELFPMNGGPQIPIGITDARDGNFYGTTEFGGSYNSGTVFKMTPSGSVTVLHSFSSSPATNGNYPIGGLLQNDDGLLYGVASDGGSSVGTAFRIATNGVFERLALFGSSPIGSVPLGALVTDHAGNFYGVTTSGGIDIHGTVFKITTNGALTTLVSFDNGNGANPNGYGLTPSDDGAFYGTTSSGGSKGKGTIFKVTTNGDLTTLVHFNGTNGSLPRCNLCKGDDGNFYGVTSRGGQFDLGTAFKMTMDGALSTLISFDRTNGSIPHGGIAQGRDGNLYGATSDADFLNPTKYGTFFKMTTNGTLTTLIYFNGTNALNPFVTFTSASDGNLYGTLCGINRNQTLNNNVGTIFRLVEPPVLTILQTNDIVKLRWTSFTNGIYRLEKISSWDSTNWTAISSNIIATGNSTSFTNAMSGAAQEFYRVVLLP